MTRIAISRIIGFTVCFVLFTLSASAANRSAFQLIEDAYRSGAIDAEQRTIYLVMAVKRPSELPVEFRSTSPELSKCATEVLLEAQRILPELSADNQTLLKSLLLARPSATASYNSPGGWFKIHYNTTGSNAIPTADVSPANGIPDYAEWLAAYADSSWRTEINNLDHRVPPSDGVAGGDSRYDIYTEEMGFYGYTQSEGAGPEPWNDAISYISVHRNFSGFPANDDPDGDQKGAAKATIAHEFYHAVQFAYDIGEQLWWMEASATWMEDVVFDPVNDNYNYLGTFFTTPDQSLHSTTNGRQYSEFIWPKYLDENYGPKTMTDIWELLISTTAYSGMSTVLTGLGKNLSQEVARFGNWNYITSNRNDGLHFEEAVRYPLISLVRTHTSYPVSGQGPVATKFPDAYGANYVRFNIPVDASSFVVDFNGDNTVPWIVNFLAYDSLPVTQYTEFAMTLDGSGDGSFTLNSANTYKALIMVIINASQSLNDRSYSYGATYTTLPLFSVAVDAVSDDSLYSNTTAVVSFVLRNTGSQSETFDIDAANDLGWPITPFANNVDLDPAESTSVNVQVTAPAGTMPTVTNLVYLTATSQVASGVSATDSLTVEVFLQRGDADNSGVFSINDAVFLINYIFASGPTPVPLLLAGDANCDGAVSIADAVYLLTYIFGGGPTPPCNPL